MKASEILRRYGEGDRNFQRMNLRGLSFKGKNLSGADFSEADIRGTNFSGANLTGTKFRGAIAGLQKRWVVILLVISWLLAALSGVCSLWMGIGVALIFNSNPTNVVAGWICLVFLSTFFVISVRKGAGAGAGAVTVAVTVVFAVAGIGAVAATIAGAIAGAGVVAVAVALAVALAGVVAIVVTIALALALALAAAFAGVFAFAFAGVFAFAVAGTRAIAVVVAGAFAGVFAVAMAVAIAFAQAEVEVETSTEAGAYVVMIAVAVAVALLGLYLGWRAIKGDPRDAWIRNIAIVFAATGGTNFYKANLTDADFSKTILKSTDLREAILTRTCWQNTEKLDRIRPGNTLLKNPQVRELLKTGNGYKKSFQNEDLRGANLQGANLENANLKQADLSEAILRNANLKETNLTETLAIGTDFTGAYLTGACLEAWNIDPTTILDRIDCQYIFLLEYPNTNGSRERRPHHPDKTFDRGDFEKLYKQLMNTVQFLLKNGINREAFREAFQQIIAENPEITWDSIQKIERKGEDVLVEVTVPETTDKAKIERTFDTAYHTELQARIEELTRDKKYLQESNFALIQNQSLQNFVFDPKITVTTENKNMSDNPNIQTGDIKGGSVGGDFNASNSVLNIDNLNSTITNQINELPATSEPEKPGIKELLEQLQTAINTDENLSEADKTIALEQVQTLGKAGKEPKNSENQGIAKRAFLMLQGIVAGLPAAAKLAETCKNIIPTISSIFGL